MMVLPHLRPFVLIVALAITATAQSGNEGSIEGTVSDSSGAVIVGTSVSARNLETSASFRTATDEGGRFRFLVVPVGSYEITAEHPGFARFVQRDILVRVGARISLPIALRVGTREESVVVSSEAPLVETTRTSFSTAVDQRSVSSLPLNGRNFLNFILLTPGVTNATGQNGYFYSFAGQISMNSLLVDGADHNNFTPGVVGSAGGNRYLFSQEAIEEFQVNTNSYSAEFGRAGTAVINVVTKSGTNQLHGTLFWYYRDRGLNATAPMNKISDAPKDPFHAHQFGGAVGGPLRKDRLFFYGSYDGQLRSEQNFTMLNLPTGFAFSSDAAIATHQKRALDYLAERAQPYIRTFNQNVALGKLDWRIAPAHLLNGRWNRHHLVAPNFAGFGAQQSLEHNGTDEQIVDSVAVSLTSTLSPSRVNVARFSYVSSSELLKANSSNPEASVFEGGQQVLQIGHAARMPVDNHVNRGEWADTLSFSHGRHAPKLGGNVMMDWGRFLSGVNFFGTHRFNSLESFGRSLAGTPVPQTGERYIQAFSALGTPPVNVNPNYVQLGIFAQDEWRIRSSLTLSLGLRYEAQVFTTTALQNSSTALAQAGINTSFIPTDANNFAPRVGLAWSPLRSNRLVIRAGYGLYFPRLVAATVARAYFQNGITVQTRTFSAGTPGATLIPAYPNTICGPPDPAGSPPACAAPASGVDVLMAFSRSYRQSVVQQNSFGIEYQFLQDLAVSVSYIGVAGKHLYHWQDTNLAEPAPATIGIAGTSSVLAYDRYPSTRPITAFDRMLLLTSNASSQYHGLAVQVNKRFARNLQLLVAYTLGKALDNNPTLGTINPGPGDSTLPSDSLRPVRDRGPGDYDQRHRLVASGVWELNYGKGLPGLARAVVHGWELSGILALDSGQAYSAKVNFDLNNDGNSATDRPPGVGRNTFYLPTTVSFDSRLTRKIQLHERAQLRISWDAFNVFNRANINGVRTTQFARSASAAICGIAGTACLVPQDTGATAFGTPTGALDPRIMQFSARLLF